MESVGYAIKLITDSDWIGFMAVDIVYNRKDEFPNVWNSLLHTHLNLILKYTMVLNDPTVAEHPSSFDKAYENVSN